MVSHIFPSGHPAPPALKRIDFCHNPLQNGTSPHSWILPRPVTHCCLLPHYFVYAARFSCSGWSPPGCSDPFHRFHLLWHIAKDPFANTTATKSRRNRAYALQLLIVKVLGEIFLPICKKASPPKSDCLPHSAPGR